MRIAVVCPYDVASYGGVQSLAIDLVSRLNSDGEEAYLVAPGVTPATPMVSVGKSTTVPGNGARSPIALGPASRRRTRLAVEDADVVHVHEPLMPQVSLAALTAGRPTVATFHADIAPWTSNFYRRLRVLGAHLLGDAAITAVSPVAESGLPASWGPVTIIPNAIDVSSFEFDVDRHANRVVFVGRDDPRKGLDVLISAWPEIRDRCGDAELHVIGTVREPLAGVTWHGRVDDGEKRQILASASVYVAPNLGGESFGIVLAEAMAAGCAVVASDLPAFRAVAGDSVTLVPVSQPAPLAEAVTKLLSDPAECRQVAQRGRERVLRFDWSEVLVQYRRIYRNVQK